MSEKEYAVKLECYNCGWGGELRFPVGQEWHSDAWYDKAKNPKCGHCGCQTLRRPQAAIAVAPLTPLTSVDAQARPYIPTQPAMVQPPVGSTNVPLKYDMGDATVLAVKQEVRDFSNAVDQFTRNVWAGKYGTFGGQQ